MKTPRSVTYTISQAARKLGISRAAVHLAIKRGRLEGQWGQVVRLVKTKALRISAASLAAYRVSLTHKQAGEKKTLMLDSTIKRIYRLPQRGTRYENIARAAGLFSFPSIRLPCDFGELC